MSNKTALYDDHVALKAHMVLFSNTWLPVRYNSEKDEHRAVREAVGIFDVSHMGEFLIRGDGALPFLQRLLTNNVAKLALNHAQYTLMLNDMGGIIDDLILYRLGLHDFLLCVNANNVDKDFRHIQQQMTSATNLKIANHSDRYSQIAVQGRNAASLLRRLTDDNLPERFCVSELSLLGIKAIVSRTGYTGEDGFEILVDNQDAPSLWRSLLQHGGDLALKPCGLAARDSLRLEAGLLLHGQDIDETTTPDEARLRFAVDMSKDDFVGKLALDAKLRDVLPKKLFGFRLSEKGIARHGFTILDGDMQPIGVVTSGTLLPDADFAIGLCYISAPDVHIGQQVLIDIRGRMVKASLKKPRFL